MINYFVNLLNLYYRGMTHICSINNTSSCAITLPSGTTGAVRLLSGLLTQAPGTERGFTEWPYLQYNLLARREKKKQREPPLYALTYPGFTEGSSEAFPRGSMIKNLPANAGDGSFIPESGRSPGEGNGNPLPYSCLGDPMDRGAWQATIHGVAKESDTTQQLFNNNPLRVAWGNLRNC